MVWFVVDDVLPFHERVLRAGNAAMGLWVRAGAWCTGQLTDGFIPADVARTMGSAREIAKLIEVGLWEAHTKEGKPGYLFHAWAEDGTGTKRQLTKAEVEEKRRKEREKKRAQREKASRGDDGRYSPALSPDVSLGDTLGDSQGESHRSPSLPFPTPSSLRSEGGAPPVDNSGDTTPPSPFCPAHPGGTDRPCRPCGDARRAHDTWQPPAQPRQVRHIPGLCDDHRQPEATCEMCAYENAHAANVLLGRFGAA